MRRFRRAGRQAAVAAAVALLCVAADARAQGLGVTNLDENAPIEIEASEGIEWRREDRLFVARGDARAKQGNVTVRADTLSARYREAQGGGNQVYRVEATGNVRIAAGVSTLEGDKGVYDLDRDVMTVTGDKVVLVTPEQRVVASESMEFDNRRQVAVARGDATVARGDQRIRADMLTAYFERDGQGRSAIRRIDAAGDVHVSTPSEIARANKGSYDLARGLATLSGSVRITRGPNQLNGENAEVNLRTGVSRLTGAPGEAGGRVRALIVPNRASQNGGQAGNR
jgi:lipopolysaccharide export system protein LptA